MKRKLLGLCPFVAAGLVASSSFGQIQVAGNLLVNVDATGAPVGPLAYLTNSGALGGVFLANNNNVASVTPQVIALGGSGTRGVLLDGNCISLRHYTDTSGATIVLPPAGLTGANPVFSVEAWAYKHSIMSETALVAWGTRTTGQNVSCNWGRHISWGGFSWQGGGYDHGWNIVPSPGAWHHLVWTYDGNGNLMLYRDGVLDKAAVQTSPVNVNPDYNIVLGVQHNNSQTAWFGFANGVLAKVRVHDGVLTPTQVANNYAAEVGAFTNGTFAQDLVSGPIHRWSFNQPPTNNAVGLTVPDTGSAPAGAAVIKGNANTAYFDGNQLNLSGGSSASAAYVDLPNFILSPLSSANGGPGQVTFEMWATPTAQNWSRLMDFGSNTVGEITAPGGSFNGRNYILVAAQVGGDLEHSRVEVYTTSGSLMTVGSRLVPDIARGMFNQTHYVVTWDEASNTITIYVNGVKAGSYTVAYKINSVLDVNNWLGRSNWSGDANLGGGYREFRMYDRVLSEAEVRRNYLMGPADTLDASTLVWNGSVDGNWNTTTANWLADAASVAYTNGASVRLDDSATGTTTLSLNGTLTPKSLAVVNESKSYTLGGSGKLSGSGGLLKEGSGPLTFTGSQVNDYTGPTVLRAGKTIVTSLGNAGTPSALGVGGTDPTNLVVWGTLSYQGPAATTDRGILFGGPVSTLDVLNQLTLTGTVRGGGSSGFAKTGPGTLVFASGGSNILSGGAGPGFNVVQGTVVFDGNPSGGTQTNRNMGELWVGGTTAYGANMIISNSTLLADTWVGIGRGNGSIGNLSTLTLENGRLILAANGLAMGYQPGYATNLARQRLTLNGSSYIYLPGNLQIGESVGSSAETYLNGTSWIRNAGVRLGMSASSTGALYLANSAVITNVGGYTSIGTGAGTLPGGGGVGTMVVKDNAAFYSTGDFNVSDTAYTYGALTVQNNGFVSSGTLFVGKANGSEGVLNLAGGTVAPGAWASIGRYSGSLGTLNVSAGALVMTNTTTALIVGEEGQGTLNVSGTGLVLATNHLRIGNAAGASGTVNLDGGTLVARRIYMNNASAYSSFNFNGGTLRAGENADPNFLSGLSFVMVLSGGAVIDSGTNDIAIVQDLYDGGGGLTKLGTGSLRLGGSLYYTGPTVVSAGKLTLPTTTYGNGAITVADNAGLGVQIAAPGTSVTTPSVTLGTAAGGALEFDLGTFGNPFTAPLAVSGALTKVGVNTISISPMSTLSVGTVPLIQYGSLAGAGSFVLGTLPPGVVASLATNTVNNTIDLVVTSVSLPRWEGLAGGTWDIGITTNWLDRVTLLPMTFQQGYSVVFDDSAQGTTSVTLNANVTPGGVLFSNSVLNYTISGSGGISGGSGLVKAGTGSLTLSTTNNTYTGPTVIEEGGTLISTVANNLGANSPLKIGTGTLSLGSNNQKFSSVTVSNGNITGSGAVVTSPAYDLSGGILTAVLGGGTVTVSGTNNDVVSALGANTYTGRTLLTGNTLLVTNLANGGLPSGVGASSADPTNLVFAGGTLNYAGAPAVTDRGFTINGAATLAASGNLTLTGPVLPAAGSFYKSGPAVLTHARPGTNVLTPGGYYIAQGTVVLDGGASTPGNYLQTNIINGELWVGYDQVNAGAMLITNSSLSISSWLAIDRGNGTIGSSSKLTLYDSVLTAANFSMGYANNIVGNSSFPVLQLLGNSSLTVGARTFIGESTGADATVVVAGNSRWTQNSEWFALGNSGKGTLILSNNAVVTFPGDYNLGDLTGGDGTLYIYDNATNRGATLYVGKRAGSVGVVYQYGGYLGRSSGGGDWRIAGVDSADATAVGTYNLYGGVVEPAGNFQIGAWGNGTWNQSGGTCLVSGWPAVGRFAGSVGTMTVSGGVFSQTGTGQRLIVAEEGTGTLTVNGTGLINCVGGLSIGHQVTGNGTVNLDGGRIVTPSVYGNVPDSTTTLNLNGGVLEARANSATFINNLDAANVLAGGAIIDSSTNTITIPQPLLDGGAGGGLVKLGAGVLVLSGANTYTGLSTVSNGFLVVNGQIPGAVRVKPGAALAGNGVVGGVVTVEAGGALSAGTSIGTLTLGASPVLGGYVVAEVDRNGGSPLADRIEVTGNPIAYGGTLVITNTGAPLQVNDTFKLFNATGYIGSFTLLSLTPGQNVTWDTANLTVNGTIRVASAVGTVPTTPTNITFGVTGNNLDLWWPTNYTGWRLEVQTNALSVGLSNNWSTWPNSTNVNAVSIPLNPNNPTVFFRLVYP